MTVRALERERQQLKKKLLLDKNTGDPGCFTVSFSIKVFSSSLALVGCSVFVVCVGVALLAWVVFLWFLFWFWPK